MIKVWFKVYLVACCLALILYAKMQYYGESFFSESDRSAHSNVHSSSGGSHRYYHK